MTERDSETVIALFHAMIQGDEGAACALHDFYLERGETMLPFEKGETYIFRDPIWMFIGTVLELGPTWVKLAPGGLMTHSSNRFGNLLKTGEFESSDEVTLIPHVHGLSMALIAEWFEFPFKIPTPPPRRNG